MRAGQGVAVSVAIMTALTLVLGLALYSYFSSHYAEAAREGMIESMRTRLASVLELAQTYHSTGTLGTVNVSCSIAKIYNNGDQPITLHLTVLPLEVTPTSVLASPLISKVPVDQAAGVQNVFVYTLEDGDGDGFKEIMGTTLINSTYLGSCSAMAGDPAILSASITPDYVDAEKVLVEDMELSSLASLHGYNMPHGVPVWRISLGPGEATHIVVLALHADRPLYLALLAPVDGLYVTVTTLKIG